MIILNESLWPVGKGKSYSPALNTIQERKEDFFAGKLGGGKVFAAVDLSAGIKREQQLKESMKRKTLLIYDEAHLLQVKKRGES